MRRKSETIVTIPDRFVPQFWGEADGRCSAIKEIRRRCDVLKADAGCDSYQKEVLCQRAIFIGIQLETMESVAMERGELNPGVYTQMTNTLVGLLKSLGLERRAKSVENLQQYVTAKKSRRKRA